MITNTTMFNDVPEARRRIMKSIKASETRPEKFVRSMLQRLGYRFRKNDKTLPGKPDIVFSARKKVIFIHGCFWHSHSVCRPSPKVPKVRSEYWQAKFARTAERDSENLKELQKNNWSSLVIWECELLEPELLYKKIVWFLGPVKNK